MPRPDPVAEAIEATPRPEPSTPQSADQVEVAARLIDRTPASVELIRFLNGREGNRAHLDEIAQDLLKTPVFKAMSRRGTVRKRYERARDGLESAGAPVRLVIKRNVVEMVFVPDPPGRSTRM